MHSHELARAARARGAAAVPRPGDQAAPREDGAVAFHCEACRSAIHDLRSVFLVHREEAGWRIECSRHDPAHYEVDGGRLFGGGLHALDLLAGLAQARWFEPAALFDVLQRLQAQASGHSRAT